MFRGIQSINLDAKGRLAIPARYRETILSSSNGELVLTIDTEESCLLLYPVAEWETIQAKIESLPSFNQTARRIQRLLIGYATDVPMDKMGRVLLPALLREYAHLDKHVMLVGQGKKFEIWCEEAWHQRREQWLGCDEGSSDDIPEELKNLSL